MINISPERAGIINSFDYSPPPGESACCEALPESAQLKAEQQRLEGLVKERKESAKAGMP